MDMRVHCRDGVEYFEQSSGLEHNTFLADSAAPCHVRSHLFGVSANAPILSLTPRKLTLPLHQ